jgi:hypothetical protein
MRAFVLLLSAHFQGFCRDLYTECSVIVVAKVRPSLRALLQRQFTAHRALDHGNPNVNNIREDFSRFDFDLDLGAAPTGLVPLTLPAIQAWRGACDGLAVSLGRIMYNQLRRTLRRAPWVP